METDVSIRVRRKQCNLHSVSYCSSSELHVCRSVELGCCHPLNKCHRMVESSHCNIHKPFERLPLHGTASNKVIFYRWGAILTQLNPMNADSALTEAVSESDKFRNVNTTYANSGNVSWVVALVAYAETDSVNRQYYMCKLYPSQQTKNGVTKQFMDVLKLI